MSAPSPARPGRGHDLPAGIAQRDPHRLRGRRCRRTERADRIAADRRRKAADRRAERARDRAEGVRRNVVVHRGRAGRDRQMRHGGQRRRRGHVLDRMRADGAQQADAFRAGLDELVDEARGGAVERDQDHLRNRAVGRQLPGQASEIVGMRRGPQAGCRQCDSRDELQCFGRVFHFSLAVGEGATISQAHCRVVTLRLNNRNVCVALKRRFGSATMTADRFHNVEKIFTMRDKKGSS